MQRYTLLNSPDRMSKPARKKKNIARRILKALLITAGSFLLLIVIAVVLLMTQQQRITNMAVEELNKQFKGAFSIQKSSIDLLKNWPNVSIALHELKFFADKTKSGSPIYQVDKLYVGFSLPDILQQQYNVRRIFLKGGHLHMVREKNGQVNLLEAQSILPDTTSSATAEPDSSAALHIDLKKAVLKDLDISFLDKTDGRYYNAQIEKITSSFKTDSATIRVALETNLVLDLTSATDTTFFRHKKIALDFDASLDKQKKLLHIVEGGVKLEEAELALTGTATALDKALDVDLAVKGNKPNMEFVSALIPDNIKEMLKPFQYDGKLYFDGKVKGILAKGSLPLIEMNFGLTDAWFHNTSADRKLDKFGFAGFYTNGTAHNLKTSELRMTNVSARPGKGVFDGNFVIRDFTDPHVMMQLKSMLELQFIGEFLGIPDLKHITGTVKLDMNFKELTDINLPEKALHKLKEGVQSELTVTNLSFRIPNFPHPVRDMFMHAEMRNGKIVLDTMRLKIGNSDLRINAMLSDLLAVLHENEKPVSLVLNAHSDKIVLKELFANDTAKAKRIEEEIKGFGLGLQLSTTVKELRNPSPLPKGVFELKELKASFKKYPHVFHRLGATVTINDTALLLRDFVGMIDSTDLALKGKVVNYPIWFQPVKKGKTTVAFDFKSNRLALADLLGPVSKTWVSESYQQEEGSNIWLRAKADLKYDSVFRFAKVKIANVSGSLKQHRLKLDSISGSLMYGSKILKLDTLKGKIGRTDFDLNFRYYTGDNPEYKKKTNYLYFKSRLLDVNELMSLNFESFAAARPAAPASMMNNAVLTDGRPLQTQQASNVDTSNHAKAFNIFMIPFFDFEVKAEVGRVRYKRLGISKITAKLRMQEDHMIHIDTLGMNVADGSMGIKGYLNGVDPKKIFFRSRITVNDVDLEKMMIRLDHFGQDLVINKNIKGRLSGNIRSHVQVHPDLVPLINDSKAQLDIEIRNGTLVDFAPMQAMSGYFKDKNLRMVRFDTLKNILTFTNGVLDIPSMNINSSLGFMEISGKQSLDMKMEYYLRIPLKMVTQVGFRALFGGRKQEEVDLDQVDEIEFRDKDKRVRFMNIRISGTPDDYKIGLGKDKSKKK